MPSQIGAVSYEPIKASYVLSSQGVAPALTRVFEDALQTYKLGVPVRLVGGFLRECAFTGADVVYGVSSEQAHNYTVAGGGATFGLPPIFPPSIELNDTAAGPPPNQPNAVVTPMGAAPRDGQCGNYNANGQTIFTVALKLGQVFTQALLVPGTLYGLTKDATSGFWYMDTTVTSGNSAVANLIGLDGSSPNDAVLGARVFFQFASSRRAF